PTLVSTIKQDHSLFRVRLSEKSLSHNAGNVLGLRVVSGNSPFELASFKIWTEDQPRSGGGIHHRVSEWQLMQLTATRYIISSRRLCGSQCKPADGIRQLGREGGLRLFTIRYPLPPAFFVTHAVSVSNERQAIQGINRPGFDPQKTLFLQGTPGHSTPFDPAARLRADVVGYGSDLVDIRTTSDRPAFLFTSEVVYPGWQASIDGRPTPILTADGIFRALDVPAGRHQVVFQYVPRLFYSGAAISAATAIMLALAAAFGRRIR
ncbi:MAG: YfhO family protein, partial [Chloroflexota bacterium]